ncbi:UBA domain-containing protein [Gluconobacter roseus]|uniref:hypothetical protein n=1 Tax=Gluconobacter roseus TaxID=586239 RepID=UPI000785D081|nr:hypothetical protein [Gluconobacter roseus]KXV43941.1 hypothetical protein AD943_05780 [Gluconobacter roseus]
MPRQKQPANRQPNGVSASIRIGLVWRADDFWPAKFTLAPYRVGRQLDQQIEQFIEQAPQFFAQKRLQQQGGTDLNPAAACAS